MRRAGGDRKGAIRDAEGKAKAIETVYSAITAAKPDATLLAILQLETLGKFADTGTHTLLPYESAALPGAAKGLRAPPHPRTPRS